MNNKNQTKIFVDRWFWAIALITLISFGIIAYYFDAEIYIVSQNMLYFSIILACMKYVKRGLVFSVVLALVYLILVLIYSQDLEILLQAIIRTVIFIVVSFVITYFSSSLLKKVTVSEEQLIDLIIKNQKKYDAIFNQSPIAIEFYDVDGKLIIVNDACLKMFGVVNEAEIFGFKMFEDPNITAEIKTKLFDGEIVRFEVEFDFDKVKQLRLYETSCSETKILDWCISPLIEDGLISGYLMHIQDITERKLANNKIRKNEERLRIITENISDIVSIMDMNFSYEYISNSVLHIRDFTVEEVMKQSLAEILTPNSLLVANSIFMEELKLEEEGNSDPNRFRLMELEEYKKDGSTVWVESKMSFRRNQDGQPIGIVSISRDITERQLANEVLRKERERLEGVIKGTNVGTWEWNVQTGEIVLNNRWAEIIGYALDEISPASIETWIKYAHLDDLKESNALLEKHFNGELNYYEFDSRMKHRDGSWIWVMDRGRVVSWTEDGKPLLMAGTHLDITERKKMQVALIEAERLSAIVELSAGVAHDFNNALQIIYGNLELVSDLSIPQEAARLIDIAKRSAGDAAEHIKQLQRFTENNLHGEYQSLNVNAILDETILQARPLWKDIAEKRGLKISFQKDYGRVDAIDGDSGEIHSIFNNLIKNAVEAMPIGGLIRIETGVEDFKVFVRIIDTGIGMNEEIKKRIFQPFFSTKGLESGRGLGMSSVSAIVRDHGGEVYVKETVVGKGATIEVLFPIGKLAVAVKKISEPSIQKKVLRVLWVDDEEPIRTLGRMYMEKMGHFANTANGGVEALDLLAESKYDLVITDIGMPGMDGWQLADSIRNIYSEVKVVIVSGWGAEASIENKIKYGVACVLGKPTSMGKLREMIETMFF